MAVHWKIPFKSFGGTTYEVRIYDDDFTGSTPVTLVGGVDPFVTQEDDDEDVFTPIRTQTGYIRIFDDGKDANGNSFNWRDLIPVGALDRRVELYSGSTLRWSGYIQPQSFSGDIYNGPQEREFPICDRLTILKCYDVVPGDYQSSNFARLLYYIFSKIPTGSSLQFDFGGGSYIDGWLKKGVMWSLFGELDNSGNVQAKYSCYEMLEEVCKFFGWTCRLHGSVVYFELSGDSSTWRLLTYSALNSLGNGSSYAYNDSTPTPRTSLPGTFASMNNSETFVPGWRKCRVESDVDKISTVIEYPQDEMFNRYKNNAVTRSGTYYYQFTKLAQNLQSQDYDFEDVKLTFRSNNSQSSYYVGTPWIYANSMKENPNDLSFNNVIYIEKETPTSTISPYLMRMTTKSGFWIANGILVISGKTYIDGAANNQWTTYTAAGYLICYLKIGGKYAVVMRESGNFGKPYIANWSDNFSSFFVETGNSEDREPTSEQQGMGQIINTRIWSEQYPSYDGFGLPLLNNPPGGVIEFGIVGFHDSFPPAGSSANMRGVCIQDLKIEFFRENSESVANDADTNKYVASGNRLFFHEKEVHTIFTCDSNNQFGLSIITNPDGSYCQTLTFADGDASAGQHLANRMASFGNKIRRVMQLDMNVNDAYNPAVLLNYESVKYATLSISRNWCNDTYTMKFIEIS